MSDVQAIDLAARHETLSRFHPQVRKAIADARAERARVLWSALQSVFGRRSEMDHHTIAAREDALCCGHAI